VTAAKDPAAAVVVAAVAVVTVMVVAVAVWAGGSRTSQRCGTRGSCTTCPRMRSCTKHTVGAASGTGLQSAMTSSEERTSAETEGGSNDGVPPSVFSSRFSVVNQSTN
jgi:hypothetical protein